MATKQQPPKAIQNGKSASKQESKKSEMSKAGVDQELIRQLAALLTETDLSEIEIETDGLKLRVARQVAQAVTHVAAPAPAAQLTAVLVDDGQPVEFGDPLFVIE